VRLTAISFGARDINVYEFAPLEDEGLSLAEAGAHISLKLPNGLERQYSLLDAEEAPGVYRIGVKRDLNSRGGSAFMHEQLRSAPSWKSQRRAIILGLTNAGHTVLIGGGIGLRPLYQSEFIKAEHETPGRERFCDYHQRCGWPTLRLMCRSNKHGT
jgi:ferredoxin-NADP reductase